MEKALKTKWVKALTSGKYPQNNEGRLRTPDGRYCCLGVLGEAVLGIKELPNCWLTNEQEEAAGLRGEECVELASLNDYGVPFDMIAGLIETAL